MGVNPWSFWKLTSGPLFIKYSIISKLPLSAAYIKAVFPNLSLKSISTSQFSKKNLTNWKLFIFAAWANGFIPFTKKLRFLPQSTLTDEERNFVESYKE